MILTYIVSFIRSFNLFCFICGLETMSEKIIEGHWTVTQRIH